MQAKVIRIKCPNLSCQRILAVPAHARGKLVKCRRCRTTIQIPQPKAQEAKSPQAQADEARDAA